MWKQNFGLARIRCSAFWMPRSKRAGVRRPASIEREQALAIDVGHVAAVRAARERRDDLPRARIFLGRASSDGS